MSEQCFLAWKKNNGIQTQSLGWQSVNVNTQGIRFEEGLASRQVYFEKV